MGREAKFLYLLCIIQFLISILKVAKVILHDQLLSVIRCHYSLLFFSGLIL